MKSKELKEKDFEIFGSMLTLTIDINATLSTMLDVLAASNGIEQISIFNF